MAADVVECSNCGHANPAWAQVCRSCGAPLAAAPGAAPASPTFAGVVEQGSLLPIGAAVGTIVLAIVIGLVVGGILPPSAPVSEATPTPIPSASAEPTAEPTPDPSATVDPSASVGPTLPGTLSFGLGLNAETQRVTNPTDTFAPGSTFAHSVELTEPFGVTLIGEGVWQINEDGSETMVIDPTGNQLSVDAAATVDGFTVPTNLLLDAIGAGNFVMRVYRGTELLAEGQFTLTE